MAPLCEQLDARGLDSSVVQSSKVAAENSPSRRVREHNEDDRFALDPVERVAHPRARQRFGDARIHPVSKPNGGIDDSPGNVRASQSIPPG